MNGNTAMPTLQFGPDCTYDVLDSILNGNKDTGWTHGGVRYGWAVRIWLGNAIITALWGWTHYDYDLETDVTKVLAWSEGDYCKPLEITTDMITRLEIL